VKSNFNPRPETPVSKYACRSSTLRNRVDDGSVKRLLKKTPAEGDGPAAAADFLVKLQPAFPHAAGIQGFSTASQALTLSIGMPSFAT
jgi:hypothetical protein